MKRVLSIMIMNVALICMILMFSGKSMAAMMPSGEFAGIAIERGSANHVMYQTGGVGIEERAAMLKGVKDYSLKLIFATTKGLYLAAIPVQIKTPEGKVILSKESNGPWFWVNLPTGKYEVVASYKNLKRVLKVDMGITPQSVELAWKPAR
jgi:hypothetical protein